MKKRINTIKGKYIVQDSIYTKDYILAGNGSSDYIRIEYEIPSNNGTGFIYSGNLKYSGFNKFYVWGN